MALSKKLLQPPKKTTTLDMLEYSVVDSLVRNDGSRIANYYNRDYGPSMITSFPDYYYIRMTQPQHPALGRNFPRRPNYCHGQLFIHLESTFTNEAGKELLRRQRKFSWNDYYRSILNERFQTKHLPVIRAAIEFGMHILVFSDTPTQYKKYIQLFWKGHNLDILLGKQIYHRNAVRSSVSTYLNYMMDIHVDRSYPVFPLYNDKKYKIKYHDCYTPSS
jgi:hypothetical protein